MGLKRWSPYTYIHIYIERARERGDICMDTHVTCINISLWVELYHLTIKCWTPNL